MLSLGNLFAALLTLVRNILIARLISVEDFGIASTFAIAITLIETGTNIGLDRLIVQDRRGGRCGFLAQLHAVQMLRGTVGAGLTLIFAHIYANLMGLSEHVWAYQCLALVPLIRGVTHLGIFRAQRISRFAPFVVTNIGSNLLAVAVSVPAALWLDDFRAMLLVILVQQTCLVLASHLLGVRRYQLSWDPKVVRYCLSFGLPLLINGFVIFAALGGDQILVGSFLGMENLGWFAVAFSMTLVPATVLSNTLQSLFLPGLSRFRANERMFREQCWTALRRTLISAVAMVALLALIGPFAIQLLFGAKYENASAILPWLAILQGIRVAKAGPAIISIASAATTEPLIANLARLFFLPIAILWLGAGGGFHAIILTAILGELAALVTAHGLLVRRGVLFAPQQSHIVYHA